MKLFVEIIMGLIVLSAILYVYLPTWIMDYRIRGFKKSLAEGREVINRLKESIAELNVKLVQDPTKYETCKPMLVSLEAHRTVLEKSTDRFQRRLEYVIEMRQIAESINHKNWTPQEVDGIILKLNEPNKLVKTSEKMDKFLKELNGDK